MATTRRIQAFVSSRLRRIFGVWWSGGLRPSVTNGCGNARVTRRWNRRSDRDAVTGLVTLSVSQSTALHDKP